MNQSNQWPMYPQNVPSPHHQQQQQQSQQHQQHQPMQMQMPQHMPQMQQMQASQQPFNPASQWNLPMPLPPMPNGMNGMNPMGFLGMGIPPFNMFSPQMLHDALALSAPVAAADEKVLIETLIRYRAQGDNYKDALNSLHGKNGHSASLWKDYYLEHHDRLEKEVSSPDKSKAPEKRNAEAQEPKPVKPVKKPLIKVEPSPEPQSAAPRRGRPPNKSRRQSTPVQKPIASSSRTPSESLPNVGRRSTINSLTVDAPVYNRDMPPPHSEIRIPEPPSRSPTPPTKVIAKGRGNKFTDEDKDYFIKFISWKLSKDKNLSRNELCELLAEKVPHHTVPSWYAYWQNNHDLPDKILTTAHGEAWEEDDDDDGDEVEEKQEKKQNGTANRRSRYKDLSSDEDEEDIEDVESDDEEKTDVDEDTEIPAFDESAMGQSGSAFTQADLAIVARYVSTFDDWQSESFSAKWIPFGEKYTQRTSKSWAEYFRRNERTIMKLAKKIRKQGITTTSSRGRLSFDSGPPRTKRKYVAEEGSKDEHEAKASKTSAS
ncbi:hypothetical protein V5O48_001203 [Marasmius crinis-equi]|uniref:Uncharacterized protein n=1 Tax=Marasmius crinis-equi TaxID=585013 RepID=A0ABR3FZF0_9AGAR